jgi:hypothetical protein
MIDPILVGDRRERYELPIISRRPIYVRPAIHPDPEPPTPRALEILGNLAAWSLPTLIGWGAVILLVRWLLDIALWKLH